MGVLTWLRAQWDRVLGFALVAVGAVALVVAYEKAAGTRYLAEQITVLISGGLGGIFCLGSGATLLVCADIRDEWRKLDRIEGVLLEIRDELALPRAPDGVSQGTAPSPPGEEHDAPRQPAPPGEERDPPGDEGTGAAAGSRRLVARAIAVPAGLLGLIGLVVTVAGWEISASTTSSSTALDAAGWSAAGLIVAGIGAAVLIVALKRSVRLREVALLTPVALEGARRAARHDGQPLTTTPDGSVYYAAGLRHFHRSGCAALAGLRADACDRASAARRLAPCPLCEP